MSDPRIEPPLPDPAPRCICGTKFFSRRLKCSICKREAPEAAQPLYHRPPPPIIPPSRDWKAFDKARTQRGFYTNMGRLTQRIRCLTIEQTEEMVKLYNEGKTQLEIASLMGVNQASISRALAKFPDTRNIAKARMKGAADLMAQQIIKAAKKAAEEGDAGAALEVLDRLDVLAAKTKHTGSHTGETKVMVIVGTVPGTPLNVSALPELFTSSNNPQ